MILTQSSEFSKNKKGALAEFNLRLIPLIFHYMVSLEEYQVTYISHESRKSLGSKNQPETSQSLPSMVCSIYYFWNLKLFTLSHMPAKSKSLNAFSLVIYRLFPSDLKNNSGRS